MIFRDEQRKILQLLPAGGGGNVGIKNWILFVMIQTLCYRVQISFRDDDTNHKYLFMMMIQTANIISTKFVNFAQE